MFGARSCLSVLVAASLTGLSPAAALAGKSQPKVTVEGAAQARSAAEAEAAGDSDALLQSARTLGDPLLFISAGKAILAEADTPDEAAEAREPAWAALDILHFIKSGGASARWQVIPRADAAAHITDAETLLQDVDAEIERMEEEARAAQEAARLAADGGEGKKKEKRERKPGSGLLAAGSALTIVGVGGLGMIGAGLGIGASKQSEVEKVDPADQAAIDALDEAGYRANLIAYAGIGVAAVGLGVGIALLAVGAKKRKAGGGDEISFMVAPTMGGLVLSGRF